MSRDKIYFLFLNLGHFLDHLFTLVFATVAALVLYSEWHVGYAELLAYATPGFFAFGVFSLPAGWLADKWSRDGMMSVFFIGIGIASIVTSFAQTPFQIGLGLFVIGMFAAIYHPVGLAIVTMKWRDTGMRIAMNGVWGNLGVACAALITGFLIDNSGWRMAFVLPGIFSISLGFLYIALRADTIKTEHKAKKPVELKRPTRTSSVQRDMMLRVTIIVFFVTAIGSVIFQATTFALPKIFDERMQNFAFEVSGYLSTTFGYGDGGIATIVGSLTFIVFTLASLAQLIVGSLLDRNGPRNIFLAVIILQIIFFSLMPGLSDGFAFLAALGFMLGVFGEIPIVDYMIGKTASGANRARIYGLRYVVSFTALASALPLIAYIYNGWGFDRLFQILSGAAVLLLIAVIMLPKKMPHQQVENAAAE